MSAIETRAAKRSSPWGTLPPRIKVLFINGIRGQAQTLIDAFRSDSATEVLLTEVADMVGGMARLREEAFDVVLLSHEPGTLDALELIEGLRGAGTDEPVIVLGRESERELATLSFEVGADGYCALDSTTTRGLIYTFARAIERHYLQRENRRLVQAERQRLQYEHQEAERLLAQQRTLICELERVRDDDPAASAALNTNAPPGPTWTARSLDSPASVANASFRMPARLVEHYREMLRAYVIMGSGNLAGEMGRLADMLAAAEVTPRQTMQLHVQVLEELIRGLGSRSARHVMNRADLLVVELLIHLGEDYRQRYLALSRSDG